MKVLIINANLPFGSYLADEFIDQHHEVLGTLYTKKMIDLHQINSIKYISIPNNITDAILNLKDQKIDCIFYSMNDLDMQNSSRNIECELSNYYTDLMFCLDCASNLKLFKFVVIMFKNYYNADYPLPIDKIIYNHNKKIITQYLNLFSFIKNITLSIVYSPNVFGKRIKTGVIHEFLCALRNGNVPEIYSIDEVEIISASRLAKYCTTIPQNTYTDNINVIGNKISPEKILNILCELLHVTVQPKVIINNFIMKDNIIENTIKIDLRNENIYEDINEMLSNPFP